LEKGAGLPLTAMILSFLFWGFVAYLLYRLVVGFILPVYRATRKVKQGIREMQARMQQQQGGGPGRAGSPLQEQPAGKPREGDYIDFEEIKD
jgi:lipopolysaccharide export LptBFGC system permease protein LptF